MTKLKFEVGDTLVITGNTSNHRFEIGEKVFVRKLYNNNEENAHYQLVGKSNNDYWYVGDDEVELLEKGEKN